MDYLDDYKFLVKNLKVILRNLNQTQVSVVIKDLNDDYVFKNFMLEGKEIFNNVLLISDKIKDINSISVEGENIFIENENIFKITNKVWKKDKNEIIEKTKNSVLVLNGTDDDFKEHINEYKNFYSVVAVINTNKSTYQTHTGWTKKDFSDKNLVLYINRKLKSFPSLTFETFNLDEDNNEVDLDIFRHTKLRPVTKTKTK